MAADIVMPRLSDSMEEGTVLKWLVEEGGEVKRGEPLVEIETDKANMTYEADTDGVLIEVLAQEGETLPIGQVIARVGAAGEEVSGAGSRVSGSGSNTSSGSGSGSGSEGGGSTAAGRSSIASGMASSTAPSASALCTSPGAAGARRPRCRLAAFLPLRTTEPSMPS